MLRTIKIKNYQWAMLANVASAVAAWAMLLVLLRFGTERVVGEFSLLQAALLPIHMLTTLKLRTVQCSDIDSEYSVATYHALRVASSSAGIIVSVLISLLMFEGFSMVLAGFVLALSYGIANLRESMISVFQGDNKNYHFFLINIISNSGGILVFSVIFFIARELLPALFGYLLVKYMLYSFLEKKIYYRVYPRTNNLSPIKWCENGSQMVCLLKVSAPLGCTALVGALFTSFPRFSISSELGLNDLAVFTALMSLLVAYNIIVNSFVQSALPDLSRSYSYDLRTFFKKVILAIGGVTLLTLSALLIAWTTGGWILGLLFGPNYSNYGLELIYVMLVGGALSLFSICNLMLSAQRNFILQLPVYIVVACSIFFGADYFVVTYGMAGAMLSQGIGYLLGAGLCLGLFLMRIKNNVL
ncbi:hypothetical protein V6L78_24110 [Pseudomonas canadensis]|uniref:hypothetical protein n=1 Tax=Pseudomonas canadensis TaxID=915099 RepID=UPI0030CBBF3D